MYCLTEIMEFFCVRACVWSFPAPIRLRRVPIRVRVLFLRPFCLPTTNFLFLSSEIPKRHSVSNSIAPPYPVEPLTALRFSVEPPSVVALPKVLPPFASASALSSTVELSPTVEPLSSTVAPLSPTVAPLTLTVAESPPLLTVLPFVAPSIAYFDAYRF